MSKSSEEDIDSNHSIVADLSKEAIPGEEKIGEARLLNAENHCINWSELEMKTGICRRTLKRKLMEDGQNERPVHSSRKRGGFISPFILWEQQCEVSLSESRCSSLCTIVWVIQS